MMGNYHVRFLGEGAAAMPPPYPASEIHPSSILIHQGINGLVKAQMMIIAPMMVKANSAAWFLTRV
jgi:hypothetical protein